MKPNPLLLLMAFFVFLTSAGIASAAETAKPLIVGMELAYPPFEMTDTSGKPTGVSVDLATDLAKSLGRPVVIQNTSFDGLTPALKTGKVDLVISSMTATAERAQSIDFSDPYLSTGLCLLLKKDSAAKDIADLDKAGVKVAVKKGTTGHDQMSTYQNWQRNKATTRAILEPFQKESWAVGIGKGNDELKGKVNAFIKEYRAKGGFEQLGDRYLKEMKDEFKRLGYTFFL